MMDSSKLHRVVWIELLEAEKRLFIGKLPICILKHLESDSSDAFRVRVLPKLYAPWTIYGENAMNATLFRNKTYKDHINKERSKRIGINTLSSP